MKKPREETKKASHTGKLSYIILSYKTYALSLKNKE